MKIKEITAITQVSEARARPDLNPKIAVNQYILNHLDNARPLRNTSVINSFVNFTDLDFIGPNAFPEYKTTPIGIYAYPSEYVVIESEDYFPMRKAVPWGGVSKYANIFSVKGNIVDLSTISASTVKEYYRKIINLYFQYRGIQRGTQQWKKDIDYLERLILISEFDYHPTHPEIAPDGRPGPTLWRATKDMSELLMEQEATGNLTKTWVAKSLISSWRKLLLAIGIDGAVDRAGGVIHENEPVQAVFFSRKAIEKNIRVYNRYSPEEVEASKKSGEIEKFKSRYPDQVVRDTESDAD